MTAETGLSGVRRVWIAPATPPTDRAGAADKSLDFANQVDSTSHEQRDRLRSLHYLTASARRRRATFIGSSSSTGATYDRSDVLGIFKSSENTNTSAPAYERMAL